MKSKVFQLAPYFSAGLQNGVLFLGFGSIQKKISDPEQFSIYLSLAKVFKSEATLVEARSELVRLGFSELKAIEAIRFFRDSHFLIEAGSYERSDRYSRHALFYNMSGADAFEVQSRLRRCRVAILGCGGIGNLLSVNLATAGVSEIILFDNDEIELSNLTRQILFCELDVGSLKPQVLRRELLRRASQCKVSVIEKQSQSLADLDPLKGVDLIIVSADSPQAVDQVNEFYVANEIAYLNVGYIQDIAVWGPFYIPGETGCFHCQSLVANEKPAKSEWQECLAEINRGYQAPSIGPVNMLASSLASMDALKYLGGFGQVQSRNKRIGVWTHSLEITEQSSNYNEDCKVCGHLARKPKYKSGDSIEWVDLKRRLPPMSDVANA